MRPPPAGASAGFPEPDQDDLGWLHERQAEWAASGQSWDACLRSWAEAEKYTRAGNSGRAGDAVPPPDLSFGPYFFADLAEVSEADEQAAIGAGLIRANRINYIACKDTARRH